MERRDPNEPEPPRVLTARKVRWLLNLYPPLFFHRARVRRVAPECDACTVEVLRSLWTRNLNGTTFGGAIYSAADPIYAVLYWQVFARRGRALRVWTSGAEVRFVRPATSTLQLEFALDPAVLEETERELDAAGRCRRTHRVEARDREGALCAEILTEVHLGPHERAAR